VQPATTNIQVHTVNFVAVTDSESGFLASINLGCWLMAVSPCTEPCTDSCLFR
jgi:hypothetical protein